MIITNFYFNSPHYYFDRSALSNSVTDRTSFRPNAQVVRENLSSKSKLQHMYDYPDGDFENKPDYSVLHGFPDRTEINTAVDLIKSDIKAKEEFDKIKLEKDEDKKFDKNFKETVINSLSSKQTETSSVASDT